MAPACVHAGPGEDALSAKLRDCLEALGDPTAGDWSDLLDRVMDAGGRVNLSGGSAKKLGGGPEVMSRTPWAGFRATAARDLRGLPRWNEHDQIALEALSSLRSLFEDARARYSARKRELIALDYLDLEIKAAELLRAHPHIAASYRGRLRHLLVDELQDTNPMQIAFLDLLTGRGESGSMGPDRFFVGDVKQAIYRFRGSDVRNFTRLQKEIEAQGRDPCPEPVVPLPRHACRVTEPTLFEGVFEDPREEFEAQMQRMTGRGSAPPDTPYLVLLPVSNQTPTGEKASGDDQRRVEADAVAAEVASLLRRPAAVWDREEEEQRHARASDVAILLRRLSNVHLFEQALEDHGVSLPHCSRCGVLHQAGGSRPHQSVGVARRTRRFHSPSGGPQVAAVHDRRPVTASPPVS